MKLFCGGFPALVESSGDAIVSADVSGTITSWNPARQGCSDGPPGKLGENYRALTIGDAEDFESEVKASIANGKYVTGLEMRWSRKNGTVIEVELAAQLRNKLRDLIKP